MPKRLGILFILAIASCQTSKKDKREVTQQELKQRAEEMRKFERLSIAQKIDPKTLKVELRVDKFEEKGIQGVLLTPELDSRANYIYFRACNSVLNEQPCYERKIPGVIAEPDFGFPTGPLKIAYRACIIVDDITLARKDQCGPDKTIEFVNDATNDPELNRLLLADQTLNDQIRALPLQVRDALKTYEKKVNTLGLAAPEQNAEFDILVYSQLHKGPYLLGEVDDGGTLDSYLIEVMNIALADDQDIGRGLQSELKKIAKILGKLVEQKKVYEQNLKAKIKAD